LHCKYCGEDAAFEPPPIDLAYSLDVLQEFLAKDTSDVTIQFYGGEPLLKLSLLEQVMDTLDNVKHWSVQTNALLLHKLKPGYLHQLSTILASIDGREDVTDFNRGKGVYRGVLDNCRYVQNHSFKGDLIARMAVSEVADIFKEVTHLASLSSPNFDHIHWQLDSQWDDDPHARWNDFDSWMNQSYNPGISALIDWWFSHLKNGKVIGLVPFLPLMKSILFNVPNELRCGAGRDSFAINPDGTISVCPISPEFKFSVVGDIHTNTPEEIRNSMEVSEPCPDCDFYHLCGGRCLFINKTKLWGKNGFQQVCSSVKHLINELRQIKEPVLELIEQGTITKEIFNYPSFNNGCEIIP
jgi:putative peptide-modifying radical SAM enzyme